MRSRWLAAAALVACTAAHAQDARPAPAADGQARETTWAGLSEKVAAGSRQGVVQASRGGQGALAGLSFLAMSRDAMPELVFGTDGHEAGRAGLDAENSTGVPEPETYAMLTAGLGALALLVRRRRRAG